MMKSEIILGASLSGQVGQLAGMSNRHGMVAGATGTGKTVTLQVLAEGFSKLGVPIFAADVKGDLSGIGSEGIPHSKISQRLETIALKEFKHQYFPVTFWSILENSGFPFRTTISDLGPLLLSHLLDLNDVQSGVLYACFKIADDQNLLLLDLKDIQSLLSWVAENRSSLKSDYGNISGASIGAIQRDLLMLEEQGAAQFFGEPAVDLADLLRTDLSGRGYVHLLDATKLIHQSPRLYCAVMLWLLSELFEQLPEVGDKEKPRLVLFFDEAHLLFKNAPKVLLEKMTQVVRLIRSKGVGVYFVTQDPQDIPEEILGQLGLRIQHTLRAFTPKDRQAIKAIVENFRPNPELNLMSIITEMGTGEALISALDEEGRPTIVEKVLISPPESKIGPIGEEERQQHIESSPFRARYEQEIDRHSAFEVLEARIAQKLDGRALNDNNKDNNKDNNESNSLKSEVLEKRESQGRQEKAQKKTSGGRYDSAFQAMFKSAARSIGSALGRQFVRGIMGSFTKSR